MADLLRPIPLPYIFALFFFLISLVMTGIGYAMNYWIVIQRGDNTFMVRFLNLCFPLEVNFDNKGK